MTLSDYEAKLTTLSTEELQELATEHQKILDSNEVSTTTMLEIQATIKEMRKRARLMTHENRRLKLSIAHKRVI